MQSFLLKSKLCACLCVKYFIRDSNRDLTLPHLCYALRKNCLLAATFLRLRQKLFFQRLFSFCVFHTVSICQWRCRSVFSNSLPLGCERSQYLSYWIPMRKSQYVHSSFSRYDERMYGSLWTQISESLQLYLVNKKNCKLFLCVKKI